MANSDRLTHLNEAGAVHMVDVSAKEVTARVASARGRFVTTPAVIELLRDQALAKGDALAVARVAAIVGAKKTADIVPLCHPIGLHEVSVELTLGEDHVLIEVTARTAERTGVEMEALTAVAAAGLTLYDMTKAVDRSARLTDVELVSKEGGRSGRWERS
ncbi:MAG TPA: cyclic pyranopterin monophosphate synthase MoaC [Marmoricola sp.]|nr:cyclic pyranopterin monophosphate synthase MoaC [Marmoricola sp.]